MISTAAVENAQQSVRFLVKANVNESCSHSRLRRRGTMEKLKHSIPVVFIETSTSTSFSRSESSFCYFSLILLLLHISAIILEILCWLDFSSVHNSREKISSWNNFFFVIFPIYFQNKLQTVRVLLSSSSSERGLFVFLISVGGLKRKKKYILYIYGDSVPMSTTFHYVRLLIIIIILFFGNKKNKLFSII